MHRIRNPDAVRTWPLVYNIARITHRHIHVAIRKAVDPIGLSSRQTELYDEASGITRALYRRCWRSVDLMAQGNQHDEHDFASRRNNQLNHKFSDSHKTTLLSPPVNPQNELSSRVNYYKAFCREHFEGHWNLLSRDGFYLGNERNKTNELSHTNRGQKENVERDHQHHLGVTDGGLGHHEPTVGGAVYNPHFMWREEQIKQFVYLIRSGEEKRSWILTDYKFFDPFGDWSNELEKRLGAFETAANMCVRDMYRQRGWVHSDDMAITSEDEDNDSDDDDDL